MSNEMLSQDEIDALLKGTDDDTNLDQKDLKLTDENLTDIEKDALGEIGNISFGSSATALSTLLNQKVEITTPAVTVIKKENISDEFPVPYIAISVSYTDGFTGSNLLIMRQSDAAIIVDLMLGGDGTNPSEMLDEIQLSAVQEAMNQMMGSAATSMSTIFNKRVDISPPSINILDFTQGQGTDQLPDKELIVKISFRLKVGNLIDSTIMQLLNLDFAKKLVEELMNPGESNQDDTNVNSNNALEANEQTSGVNSNIDTSSSSNVRPAATVNQQSLNPATAEYTSANAQATLAQSAVPTQQHHFGSKLQENVQQNIQPAVFSNFETQNLQGIETKNLNMLLDIPLQVTVELGSTKKTVKEILELSSGSIIELDKLAGEPVDILVNNRLVAKGEVVVIDENFGVRVTDIISQSDRIKKLR